MTLTSHPAGSIRPGTITIPHFDREHVRPLHTPLREFMETCFRRDFRGILVHEGPQSAQLLRSVNAAALAIGSHIFWDQAIDMASAPGQWLLAHELAHTVQQDAGPDLAPDGREFEIHEFLEAEDLANQAAHIVSGRSCVQTDLGTAPVGAMGGPTIQYPSPGSELRWGLTLLPTDTDRSFVNLTFRGESFIDNVGLYNGREFDRNRRDLTVNLLAGTSGTIRIYVLVEYSIDRRRYAQTVTDHYAASLVWRYAVQTDGVLTVSPGLQTSDPHALPPSNAPQLTMPASESLDGLPFRLTANYTITGPSHSTGAHGGSAQFVSVSGPTQTSASPVISDSVSVTLAGVRATLRRTPVPQGVATETSRAYAVNHRVLFNFGLPRDGEDVSRAEVWQRSLAPGQFIALREWYFRSLHDATRRRIASGQEAITVNGTASQPEATERTRVATDRRMQRNQVLGSQRAELVRRLLSSFAAGTRYTGESGSIGDMRSPMGNRPEDRSASISIMDTFWEAVP